ncbi:hypothetical protein Aab01nite_31750 [Paractinoplanes abujensis]|uniref:Uncharacterized protein YegL n=1 Tax=Paractinoplanes abujensis TaxID=882441 RepID=A0A7W7D0B2_9ACTN|nr:VWA domain-containing protein [Actinoplanes abujensis]MBB4697933.1 uncharacterized protein YegL [Actinoplanes abujensis]GID19585.1 hypothetical protein Aab01nite_31750 [Actinoplanes abujensis]
MTDALPIQQAKSRLLITLVVDTSLSMRSNGAIDQLNAALRNWRRELLGDGYLTAVGEIALISFGHDYVIAVDPAGRQKGHVAAPFRPVREFDPPRLEAGGATPMVEAVQYALEITGVRKDQLAAQGIPLAHRPMIWLVTDGVPTDDQGARSDRWRDLAPLLRQQEAGRHLLFYAIGVPGAEREVLSGLAPNSFYHLDELDFMRVMRLVSVSLNAAKNVTRNQSSDEVYADTRDRFARTEEMRIWLEKNG